MRQTILNAIVFEIMVKNYVCEALKSVLSVLLILVKESETKHVYLIFTSINKCFELCALTRTFSPL